VVCGNIWCAAVSVVCGSICGVRQCLWCAAVVVVCGSVCDVRQCLWFAAVSVVCGSGCGVRQCLWCAAVAEGTERGHFEADSQDARPADINLYLRSFG
jgi:hypothetical protein